jgi:protein phosphatase
VAATVLGRFGESPEQLLVDGSESAGANVRRGIQTDLNRLGMATTLTALVTDGVRVVLGHVGDSRAYLLRDGALTQVSRDHTYVQDLVERGHLDRDSVRRHPWRNVVLRSVDGDPVHAGIDLVPLDVEVGDRLLLCSDGLTDLVRDDAIADLLSGGDPDAAAARCVDAALAAGGRDNVTCVVVDVVDAPGIVGDGQLLGAVREVGNIVDPAALGRR